MEDSDCLLKITALVILPEEDECKMSRKGRNVDRGKRTGKEIYGRTDRHTQDNLRKRTPRLKTVHQFSFQIKHTLHNLVTFFL